MNGLSHINNLNLQRESEWLERILNVRLKTNSTHKNIIPFISQLQFSLVPGPDDVLLISSAQKEYKAVFLFEKDLKTPRKNKKDRQLLMLHGNAFTILEQKNELLNIRCRVQSVSQIDNAFIPDSPDTFIDEGWIDRSYTTVPAEYFLGITHQELLKVTEAIPEGLLKAITEDVMRHDEMRLLNYMLEENNAECILPPELSNDGSAYAGIVHANEFDFYERLLLILALSPHIDPLFLERKLMKDGERITPLEGGIRGNTSGVFLPTGQTFIFLTTGNDMGKRLKIIDWICHECMLIMNGVIRVLPAQAGEPYLSGALVVDEYYLQLLLTNRSDKKQPHISQIVQQ